MKPSKQSTTTAKQTGKKLQKTAPDASGEGQERHESARKPRRDEDTEPSNDKDVAADNKNGAKSKGGKVPAYVKRRNRGKDEKEDDSSEGDFEEPEAKKQKKKK